ncbi:MAG: NAD(P)H-dependent oxidoreductase [Actinomycetes bacterium]
MRALVIYCHPVSDSFCAAMRDAAVAGLQQAGHHVDVIDLAAENFNPVMSREEWHRYVDSHGAIPPDLEQHVALVKSAQILVFVYPTWWSGLPAQLKGWLERIMVENVAYKFNKSNRVRPALTNVQRIHILSTFGSPHWYIAFVHNNGKRILSRALRLSTGRARVRTNFLYRMDIQTQQNRERFLSRITKSLVRI